MSYCFPNTLPSKDVFSRIKGQLWLWYKFPSFLGVNILCKFHQWRNALWYILHTTYLFKVGVDGRVQDTLAMSLIHHYKGLNLKFKVQMYVIYHIKYTSIYVTVLYHHSNADCTLPKGLHLLSKNWYIVKLFYPSIYFQLVNKLINKIILFWKFGQF